MFNIGAYFRSALGPWPSLDDHVSVIFLLRTWPCRWQTLFNLGFSVGFSIVVLLRLHMNLEF